MTIRNLITAIFQQEDINFLLTNHIPRAALTRFIGWFSKIENPLVRALSIAVWRLFSDLDLREAKKRNFRSLHDCFVRELKDGARTIDPDPAILVSPCDAIIGASGKLNGVAMLQAKGFGYSLDELVGDAALACHHGDGQYVTLRLTSGMYHRFHAPHDCRIEQVNYISGDTWNVNPIALRRIERLFCKNERAVVRTRLANTGHIITLVPVAAILVASIRFHFLDVLLDMKHRGPNVFRTTAKAQKGEELGWFEHGSTIILLAPVGFSLCDEVREGATIRMGQPLMRLPRDGESGGNT
jgi:phosphatidylserine decarboxylase